MIYKIKDIELDYSKISAPHIDYVPKLKLFVANDSDESSKYTPDRPTVLILPGGGYSMTSEREAEPIATHFLARGMNAAILYYLSLIHISPNSKQQITAYPKTNGYTRFSGSLAL